MSKTHILVGGTFSMWYFMYPGFFPFVDPWLVISSGQQSREERVWGFTGVLMQQLEVGAMTSPHPTGWIFVFSLIPGVFIKPKVQKTDPL